MGKNALNQSASIMSKDWTFDQIRSNKAKHHPNAHWRHKTNKRLGDRFHLGIASLFRHTSIDGGGLYLRFKITKNKHTNMVEFDKWNKFTESSIRNGILTYLAFNFNDEYLTTKVEK